MKNSLWHSFFANYKKSNQMKRLLVFGVMLMVLCNTSFSQSMGRTYKTALGVKVYPGAITIKHFVKTNRAIEGLFYFWDHGFRFTGLYEVHGDINGAPGLKWYVGPGGHIGVYREGWHRRKKDKDDDHYYYYDKGEFSLGIDGVLGLDYKIKGAPINVSLDVQPFFEILEHPYFGIWGGLAVRYTF